MFGVLAAVFHAVTVTGHRDLESPIMESTRSRQAWNQSGIIHRLEFLLPFDYFCSNHILSESLKQTLHFSG